MFHHHIVKHIQHRIIFQSALPDSHQQFPHTFRLLFLPGKFILLQFLIGFRKHHSLRQFQLFRPLRRRQLQKIRIKTPVKFSVFIHITPCHTGKRCPGNIHSTGQFHHIFSVDHKISPFLLFFHCCNLSLRNTLYIIITQQDFGRISSQVICFYYNVFALHAQPDALKTCNAPLNLFILYLAIKTRTNHGKHYLTLYTIAQTFIFTSPSRRFIIFYRIPGAISRILFFHFLKVIQK